MIFSYNWLQSFFTKKLPNPEKLAEFLTMHSFEVEEVKKAEKDWVLDIDVLPNRAPDCFSHLGIAREIAAILSQNLNVLEREKFTINKDKIGALDLKIQPSALKLTPRYSALVVEAVQVMPSPQWLRERIEAVGVRSINNIVDLTNFVMLEMGQPIHAFDYDKVLNQKMLLRESRKGEKLITLDDRKHELEKGMLVIENEENLIDLVGIMGGKLAEIDSKTKNIVLQAGNFEMRNIYRTSKELDQQTLASKIYSQGIDPNLTIPALERAYRLLNDLGGGRAVQVIDIYPKKVLPSKIKLDLDYVERLLGVKIPRTEIKRILERLGLKIENWKLKIITVEIPTWRLDISIPENLIEEIGRLYGYEKIPAEFPIAVLIPAQKNLTLFWENLTKNILKEAGFNEVYNYSFIGKKEADILNFKDLAELENPTSADFQCLRPSLIPNLLKNVAANQKFFKELKIFEMGKVFVNQEKRMLAGLMTGDAFFEAKGVIDLLLNKLGISNIWFAEPSAHLTPHPAKRGSAYDEYQPTPEESKLSIWHSLKRAEIKLGQEEIGFLGEISSKILDELKIAGKVVIFDIDFEKLSRLCSEEHEYVPISPYPEAVRDIAVLTPREVSVEDVLNKIETAGGGLIRDVDLFDIYEGEELPDGKKNLAFHIIYQAKDHTLSSKEIDEIQNKIIKALEGEAEWEVRK